MARNETRHNIIDHAAMRGEINDRFDGLIARAPQFHEIVFFFGMGIENEDGFVIQPWTGRSLTQMVEHRWPHLAQAVWDFTQIRLTASMFDPFERFLVVLMHSTAITVAPPRPTIVVEWTFQLRWSCASFLQTQIALQSLPFVDILVMVPKFEFQGMETQDLLFSVQLQTGDVLEVAFRDRPRLGIAETQPVRRTPHLP